MKKRAIIPIFLLIALSVVVRGQTKPNVLFIVVDDLRPELNCYGATQMKTPNIDRLADNGMLFQRAYCQQAICGPSRASVLTGLRPDAMGIYDLNTFFRDKVPDVVTLPQWFKQNGYVTENTGKVFHRSHGYGDDEMSWSVPRWDEKKVVGALHKITSGDTTGLQADFPRINGKKLPYYESNAREKNMTDAVITDIAIKRLKKLRDEPFFLAVGYVKPHLPFVSPRKYWDLYNEDDIQVPLREKPLNAPGVSFSNFGELRQYYGIPSEGLLDYHTSMELIHGYYAAVSMIDAQVGRLLQALEKLGLAENTIIVLWGDHGWKLGEYGSWCKHTNHELDTHAPLIISAPGHPRGGRTLSIVEFVDIYPTLCDLAGLNKPDHIEGVSLLPVLDDSAAKVKEYAISQYPRGKDLGYDHKKKYMGYTIRDEQYRYTRWQEYENPSKVIARELYDLSGGDVVKENLADQLAYKDVVKKLDEALTRELSRYTLKKSYPQE